MVSVGLAGQVIVQGGKNYNYKLYSDTVIMINVKLFMTLLLI